MGVLKKLNHLDLVSNLLKSFPKSFQRLKYLRYLQLDGNKFQSLPEWFGDLKNLTNLYLGDNKFQTLPKIIRNLENLRELQLGRNRLQSLPEWFGDLKNLEILYLGDNNIPILPESFRNLSKLGELGLRATGLRSFSNIPEEFIDNLDLPDVSWPWPSFNSKSNYPSKEAKKIIDYNLYDFLAYYRVSPLELAQKYAQDRNLLTPEEKDRLAWEGGFRERDVIEMGGIKLDDPILAEINKRLTITCDKGLELIK